YYGNGATIFAHFHEHVSTVSGQSLKKFDSFDNLCTYLHNFSSDQTFTLFYQQHDSFLTNLKQLGLLTDQFPNLQIFVVGENLCRTEKDAYLESGVTNTINPYASQDVFHSIHKYMHLLLETKEAHIPLPNFETDMLRLRIPLGKRIFDIVLSSILLAL